MDLVIAILRTPHELRALVSRSKGAFDFASETVSDEELISRYTLFECPLNSLDVTVIRQYQCLIDSWNALRNIQAWNEEGLFHLLTVLLETAPVFPSPETTVQLSPLPFETPIKKATAKHPRAYQGVKSKPPKKKTLSGLNLHPYLSDRKHLNAILVKFYPYWTQALNRLEQNGYDIDRLSAIKPEQHGDIDPYFAHHHSLYTDVKPFKLPQEFTACMLPLLRGRPWQHVLDFLSAYWGMSAHLDPALLSAFCRLLHLNNGENCLHWCRLAAGFPSDRRLLYLTLLIELEVYTTDSICCSVADIEQFHTTTSDELYYRRLLTFLSALKRKVPASYIFAGFQLADKYAQDYEFRDIPDGCNDFHYDKATGIIEHIKDAEDYYRTFALEIWRACGELAGFYEFIASRRMEALTPDSAFGLLRLYLFFYDRWELSPKAIQEKWRFLRQHGDRLEAQLSGVPPDYQGKFLSLMHDFYWYWDDEKSLRAYIPHAEALSQRLAQPPFSTNEGEISELLSYFIDNPSAQYREQFLHAPDSSFLNLEKACRSKNRARLITNGISVMVKELPGFTADCFCNFSQKLCTIAKKLGTLRRPIRHEVVRRFSRDPLMSAQSQPMPLSDLCKLIMAHLDGSVANPIPKRLQEYFRGRINLSEASLMRHMEKMAHNLNATLLDVLDKLIIDELRRDLPIPTDEKIDLEHAMQVMSLIDDNRRGFKRFLREYLSGNIDYVRTHPKTVKWIKKHPGIDFSVLTEGISLSGTSERHGVIRIELERNPLEALKLGTYSGSCLGVGGILTYSAAAVVLDFNKQVIYARDKDNAVIARQLVAISEEKELVCFSVYPLDTDREVLEMFRDYDERFANALGIGLYQDQNDKKYTIVNILSQDWWDDLPWDFSIDDPEDKGREK